MPLLTVLGVSRRFEHSGNLGSSNGEVTKTHSFNLFWPVFYGITNSFGSRDGSNIRGTPGSAYGKVTKTRSFDLLWPAFYGITHSLGGLWRFECSGNPGVCLWGGHQNSPF